MLKAHAATPLRRAHLVVTALAMALLLVKIVTYEDHPSLGLSLLHASTWPLLAASLALAHTARSALLARDSVTLAVVAALVFALAAEDVAVDQRYAAADALIHVPVPLMGLSILALIWSAIGHRDRALRA